MKRFKQQNQEMGKREKGMTLIELLFSMLILGGVLISGLYAMTEAHNLAAESRARLLAMNAARSVLETIKNTDLVNVPGINTVPFVPADLNSGTIVITTNPSPIGANSWARVTVTVNWRTPKNVLKNVQFTTMRSIY